jgi:hypothetical protein
MQQGVNYAVGCSRLSLRADTGARHSVGHAPTPPATFVQRWQCKGITRIGVATTSEWVGLAYRGQGLLDMLVRRHLAVHCSA